MTLFFTKTPSESLVCLILMIRQNRYESLFAQYSHRNKGVSVLSTVIINKYDDFLLIVQ